MQKYRWRQEFAVMQENGSTIKECNMQIYLNETGVGQEQIKKMFGVIGSQFLSLFEDEKKLCGDKGIIWTQPDMPKDFLDKY